MKLSIKVIPNSSKDEMISLGEDLFGVVSYKIKTTKPPEDGKANQAVIEILAEYFKVKKSQIKIISGLTGRNKIVEILK